LLVVFIKRFLINYSTMTRRQFDKEFKTTIVNLLDIGRTMKSIYSEYDLKEAIVYRWKCRIESIYKLAE